MDCDIILFVPSNIGSKRKAPIAQLDRAFDYESKGHRFESCWVHHEKPLTSFAPLRVFLLYLQEKRGLMVGHFPKALFLSFSISSTTSSTSLGCVVEMWYTHHASLPSQLQTTKEPSLRSLLSVTLVIRFRNSE